MAPENRVCQNCKQPFVVEPEDFDFYKKITVPPPTWCPECRHQRRLAFRNERFLYKAKSAFSGKEMFSMYHPKTNFKIYENNVWFSDAWDAMDYGRAYDFSRPFFEQLKALFEQVPLFALSVIYGVNSDYSNNFTGFKNCYLVFNGNYSEDCAYGSGVNASKNCVDCSYLEKCENCYECFWMNACANCFYSSQCYHSFNLYFSKNCVGCNDCFGCVGLRNKRYYVFNKPYSKEEYSRFLEAAKLDSRAALTELKREATSRWLRFPVKFMEGLKNYNVSGEYIHNCKNVHDSYIFMDAENVRYSSYAETGPIRDCYDYSVWGNGAELVYDSINCGLGIHNVRFCIEVWPEMRNAEYSLFCQSSSDIFGCVGLKKKKYCIFNKQYSESEYRELRVKIIAHMDEMPYRDSRGNMYTYGEFFPPSFSLWAYNKTAAHELFPMEREKAIAAGYPWEDLEEKTYQSTVRGKELPERIRGVSEDILQETILCSVWEADSPQALRQNCSKAYRIIPAELSFYRRFNIPLPVMCHNCRHYERTRQKQPAKLWRRNCTCQMPTSSYTNAARHFHGNDPCPNTFQTSYAPDRPEIVYCEPCYNAEVA